MTNYENHSNDTLIYAIDRAEKDIAKYRQLIKDFGKILDRPRGYSKKKLDGMACRISGASGLIKVLKQEIAECQEELAKR